MSSESRIVVVVPTHNRAHLLERAISSILAQTYRIFEIVVVDDGSTDQTEQIVGRFTDGRVRYLFQKQSGAAAARNAGVLVSQGEIITFLDSDDEAEPEWLMQMSTPFRDEAVGAVCCTVARVTSEDGIESMVEQLEPTFLGPFFANYRARFTNGGSFAVRRAAFEAAGGYDEELRSGQHTELAMRLLPWLRERGLEVVCIDEPLIRVHIHDGPRIRTNPWAKYEGASRVLSKHAKQMAVDPRMLSSYHAVASVNAATVGEVGPARHHAACALFAWPYSVRTVARAACMFTPSLPNLIWGLRRRSRSSDTSTA